MTLKINEKLNLVVPIYHDTESDPVGYVHSTPISRMAFKTHYRLLAAVFASLQQQGIVDFAGPTVAALELSRLAADRKDDAAATALLNEIRRLTVYVHPGANGWEYLPFYQAVANGLLDEDDVEGVENGLVFFTAASHVLPKTIAMPMTDHIMKRWGARMSSLGLTDFIASLQTSTATANTGETASSDSPAIQAELIAAKAVVAAAVPSAATPAQMPIQGRITI
jgi:hypothetical protein